MLYPSVEIYCEKKGGKKLCLCAFTWDLLKSLLLSSTQDSKLGIQEVFTS